MLLDRKMIGEVSIFKTKIGEEYNFDREPDSESKNFILPDFYLSFLTLNMDTRPLASGNTVGIVIFNNDPGWADDDLNSAITSIGVDAPSTAATASTRLGILQAGMINRRAVKNPDGGVSVVIHNRFLPSSSKRDINFLSLYLDYIGRKRPFSLVRLHTPCEQDENEIVDIFYRVKVEKEDDVYLTSFLLNVFQVPEDQIDPGIIYVDNILNPITGSRSNFLGALDFFSSAFISSNNKLSDSIYHQPRDLGSYGERAFDLTSGVVSIPKRFTEGESIGSIFRFFYQRSNITNWNFPTCNFSTIDPIELKSPNPIQGSVINTKDTIVPFLGNLGNSTVKYTLETNSNFKDELLPRAYFLEFIKGGDNTALGKYRVKTKLTAGYNGNAFNPPSFFHVIPDLSRLNCKARNENGSFVNSQSFINLKDPSKNRFSTSLINGGVKNPLFGLGTGNSCYLKIDNESFISYEVYKFEDADREENFKGISFYNIFTCQFKDYYKTNGYDFGRIYSCVNKASSVYVACDNGLFLLDVATDILVKIDITDTGVENINCESVSLDSDDNVIAIFRDQNVVRIKESENESLGIFDFTNLLNFSWKGLIEVKASSINNNHLYVYYLDSDEDGELILASTVNNGTGRFTINKIDLEEKTVLNTRNFLFHNVNANFMLNRLRSALYSNQVLETIKINEELENVVVMNPADARTISLQFVSGAILNSSLDVLNNLGSIQGDYDVTNRRIIKNDDHWLINFRVSESGNTRSRVSKIKVNEVESNLDMFTANPFSLLEDLPILSFNDLHLCVFNSSFILYQYPENPTNSNLQIWETYGWDGTQWVLNHTEGKEMDTNPTSLPYGVDISWQYPTGTEVVVEDEYLTFHTFEGILKDNITEMAFRLQSNLSKKEVVTEQAILDPTIPSVGSRLENQKPFGQINYRKNFLNNSLSHNVGGLGVERFSFLNQSTGGMSKNKIFKFNNPTLRPSDSKFIETSHILDGDFKIQFLGKNNPLGVEFHDRAMGSLSFANGVLSSGVREAFDRSFYILPANFEPLEQLLSRFIMIDMGTLHPDHLSVYASGRGLNLKFYDRIANNSIEIERVGTTFHFRRINLEGTVLKEANFSLNMDNENEAVLAGPLKLVFTESGITNMVSVEVTTSYNTACPIVDVGSLLSQSGKYDLEFTGLLNIDEIEVDGVPFEVLELSNTIPPQGKVIAQTSGEIRFSPEDAGKQITKLRATIAKKWW